MPNRFELADRTGAPIDAANPLPVAGTFAPPEGGATEETLERTAVAAEGSEGWLQQIAEGTDPAPVAMTQAEYEVFSASASSQVFGAAGAANDYIAALVIQPTTTAPGAVTLKDGSATVYSWPGSATYPAHLPPVIVPLGIKAATNWNITSGVNVGGLASGDFT